MKKIFTSPNLTHCDMVRTVLDQAGIVSELKNEYASRATAGLGTLPFAWPEIWVDDTDAPAAEAALARAQLSFLNEGGAAE